VAGAGTQAASVEVSASGPSPALGRMLMPLALAQFICSFAGSNMNVMINDISRDLDTTVKGVQTAITVFLLVMAALMIPGGKLSDRWGRKRCFTVGLMVYAVGGVTSGLSPSLGTRPASRTPAAPSSRRLGSCWLSLASRLPQRICG
jgi:MFS family permease